MEPLDRWRNHGRVDGAGTDAIDPHTVRSVVDCEALSELTQCRFTQSVHRAGSLADKYLVRTHQHDIARPLLSHHGKNFLQDVKWTFQIDRQNPFELFDAGVFDVGKKMHAGRHE